MAECFPFDVIITIMIMIRNVIKGWKAFHDNISFKVREGNRVSF